MARREIQVFNMSFLDMMTNFLGAVIILFLLAAQNVSKLPAGSATKLKVEASLDPDRLIIHARSVGAKVGDTLLFVITDTERLSCKQAIVGRDKSSSKRPYVDTTGIWKTKLPIAQQPEAIFIAQIEVSDCKNNDPNKAEDDSYTVTLQVEKTGKLGSRCFVEGQLYPYKSSIVLGPFLIKDGAKTLNVRDELNGTLTKTLKVYPPAPCHKEEEVAGGGDSGDNKGQPNLPGAINFYAEWDDPNDYVNIYVKKENRFVFGGHKRDADIGEFVEFSSGGSTIFNRKNTNVEAVRQLQKHIPGTYQVYLHYRGNKDDAKTKSEVPVKVWLINKVFPGESQPFSVRLRQTDKNPRRGGGLLVVTVEITQDGHFNIRR